MSKFKVVAALKMLVALVATARADAKPTSIYEEKTGRILSLALADGRSASTGIENRYFLMSKAGDAEAWEREDQVVTRRSGKSWREYSCTNPKLPEIEIVKRYELSAGAVRRTLTFRNRGRESKYLTPFTEVHFAESFRTNAYHFGAGYLGPYKPLPTVEMPTIVNDYLQSSKGIVLINPERKRGAFAHYRVKIDDTVVLPWWHSTIGHYREYHDRLWYLPDGYRMGLGTFGLYAGRPVAVTDQFRTFDGDLFTFFDEVFAADKDIATELKSIPEAPAWVRDLLVNAEDRNAWSAPYLARMLDDGELLVHCGPSLGVYSWGDYRPGHGGYSTYHGGRVTETEMQNFFNRFKAISPRVHVSNYGIAIAAANHTPIYAEHPEWFRPHDRAGRADSLFPGCNLNWQTMFSVAEVRKWMVKMFCAATDYYGLDTIYVDENQMTNTIDWERDRITRDDDTVRFWKLLAAAKARQGKAYFANGSGIPYADINYLEECRGTFAPENWRDGAGVVLGVAMVNRMRPSGRIVPLYWQGSNDYANRLLALGWVARPHGYFIYEVPVIRAVYQAGAMFPCAASYSPDWKVDPKTEVESYACRREGSSDVVISVINRAAGFSTIPFKVDLSSLGFAAKARINVYLQHHELKRAGTSKQEILADSEIKENWQLGILLGSRLSDPELVYSGAAQGELTISIKALPPGAMEQLVFTEGPLGFFSENGQPLNAFFTSQRKARIDGRRVTVQRQAEVLLIDREHDFTGITANGQAVAAKTVKVGGIVGKLIRLDAGEWELEWRETPSSDLAQVADLPRPASRPMTKILPFERKWIPERCEEKPIVMKSSQGPLTLTAKGIYVSGMDPGNRIQEETSLSCAAAAADEKTFTLFAGTTRREGEIEDMANFAGFEVGGTKSLTLRFTHEVAPFAPYVATSGVIAPWPYQHRQDIVFVGLMVDYRVKGKYVKRVALSLGAGNKDFSLIAPKYGAQRRIDEFAALSANLDSTAPQVFKLALDKYAPPDWDGIAWVSLGTSAIQANHRFKLEILD